MAKGYGQNLGTILGTIIGTGILPGIGSILGAGFGSAAGAWRDYKTSGHYDPAINAQALKTFWQNISGQQNTIIQNQAASALQEDAQQFNASEAEKERQWQEYMSNTAVQRQAADLKAAGFNPALAAGSSASSGMAASASSGASTALASNANPLQSLATTAVGAAALVKIIATMLK